MNPIHYYNQNGQTLFPYLSKEVEGRTFYDMDEKSIVPYLEGLFTIIDVWPSADTRSTVGPAPSRAWLNLLCKKK